MRGRITVSFDEKLIVMLRRKQADIMLDENKQISISGIVSNLLVKALKEDGMISEELAFAINHQNGMRLPVGKI